MTPVKLLGWLLDGLVFVIALRMFRVIVGPLVAAWRLGLKSHEHPISSIPGWGDAFDPVGDCSMKNVGKALCIEVPGSLHDLSVEQGQVTAPRVLRDIHGSFLVEVTVAGDVSPHGDRTSTYALPYHGTGLLIWLDRDNYIRLERAAIFNDENVFHYINFEQRTSAI